MESNKVDEDLNIPLLPNDSDITPPSPKVNLWSLNRH